MLVEPPSFIKLILKLLRSECEEDDHPTSRPGQLLVASYKSPAVNVISPEGGTLQEYLLKKDQENADAELKKLHTEYVRESNRRRLVVKLCSSLSKKILPILGIYFVMTYWSAGLLHYHRITHLNILLAEVVFTIFYFTVVIFINYLF